MLIPIFSSGLNLSDEDTFSDTLEDVVTSVKRNGAAIKGIQLLLKLYTPHFCHRFPVDV